VGLSEADTRAKLIDPAIHARGWTEDLIRRKETAGAIEIIDGRPFKQAKGRMDYTLRIKPHPVSQPVAVALIEAKPEDKPPAHGLEQAKLYAASKRLNVQFVFASNGPPCRPSASRSRGRTTRWASSTRVSLMTATSAELRARCASASGRTGPRPRDAWTGTPTRTAPPG